MSELIKKFIFSFVLIATGTLISTTLFISFLLPDVVLGVEILWQILAFPTVTTPLMFIFISKRELTKKEVVLRQSIHYILTNVLLISCAYGFKWLETGNLLQLVVFVLLVFIVYVGVCVGCFVSDQKQATTLNERIQAYQNRKQ